MMREIMTGDSHFRAPRNDISRRSFVRGATAVGSVVGAAVVGFAPAAQAQTTHHDCAGDCTDLIVVWRLKSQWSTPRGPHNKTRLESRASLRAAEHRWALSERDALDMNLHKCSWAPAEAVTVRRCEFMAIWDHNGAGSYSWRNPWKNRDVQIFDTRCLDHIDDGHELWDRAFDLSCVGSVQTNAGTSGIVAAPEGSTPQTAASQTPNVTTRRGIFSGLTTTGATPAVTTDQTGSLGAAPGELAFTGADSAWMARAGATLAFTGSGLSFLVHRRNKVQRLAYVEQQAGARNTRQRPS